MAAVVPEAVDLVAVRSKVVGSEAISLVVVCLEVAGLASVGPKAPVVGLE